MTGEQFRKLVESQDELILVCQAAFEVILDERNMVGQKFRQALQARNVQEGFAQRAEEIREEISKEYRMSLAYDTGIQIPVGDAGNVNIN